MKSTLCIRVFLLLIGVEFNSACFRGSTLFGTGTGNQGATGANDQADYAPYDGNNFDNDYGNIEQGDGNSQVNYGDYRGNGPTNTDYIGDAYGGSPSQGGDQTYYDSDCNCDLPDEEVGPQCKSKLLRGIIVDAMEQDKGDAGAISDNIQASASELFGGDFEVFCSLSDFAFRNWYSKGKMCKQKGDEFICIAWRD